MNDLATQPSYLAIESEAVRVTLDDHNPRAQRVVRSLERFVDVLVRRGDGEHVTDVLYDNETIRGTYLGDRYGQRPERFIVETLVTDVADALGYEYRSQPVGFNGLDGRYPDFTVLNADSTVIGEVKKPNQIENARDEAFDYLQMADDRPLVGIATDGFTWILHTASEGEEPEYTTHVPLRGVIKSLARERNKEKVPRQSRRDLREQCVKFADAFGVEQL
jgi:hypothetical protein